MDYRKFKEPSTMFRPVPFWSWNDRLVSEEVRRQIDEMTDKGYGGFFMHSRVGLLTAYNSPEWYDFIRECAVRAKENGIYAWLYDEDLWPSGYGSGEVSQNPEFRNRALVLLEEGQLTENDTVLANYKEGSVAYTIAKRVAPLGDPWFNDTSYVDLMNPKAVRKFLECTHERYKAECGEYFGKEIPGIFTDEPNYLYRGGYNMPALPWSDYLEDFFEERHHYRIADHIIELFFDVNDYQKTRYDFFESASNLLLQSFTMQYYDWCEKNGLKMVGHFMAEDSLNYQTSWTGFIMPHYEFMHYPGIDKLGMRVNQIITVKQASSVAEQLNKERTLSEVLGCIGQQRSFRERKWLLDWQAVLGINFVTPHLSLYSMRGERKRDFPANLYYQQPWWQEEKMFSDYVARLSEMLAQGKRDVKILFIHPIGSCWCTYNPRSEHDTPYDKPFFTLTDRLIEENLDFHYGDEDILKKHAKVVNGKIHIGQYEYTAVIVPPAQTLKQSTLELLMEFAQQGSTDRLIFLHPLAQRIDGQKAEIVFPEKAFKTTKIESAVHYLSELFDNRVKTIDKYSGKTAKKIFTCTKLLENENNEKIIFFTNTGRTRDVCAELVIEEKRTPYLIDLANGDVYDISYEVNGDKILLNVKFYAAGSFAILFTDQKPVTKGQIEMLQTGVSFSENLEVISQAEDFKLSFSEYNAMPINHAALYFNGKPVAENKPLAALWKSFYAQPDGTPFAAEYRFDVKNLPSQDVYAAIECAQNLDLITLNGNELTSLKNFGDPEVFDEKVNYKDVHFIKTPLVGLVKGENILRIEGKKINHATVKFGHRMVKDFNNYHSTELEAVYILGDFSVQEWDHSQFCIDGVKIDPDHKDLTESGYPFYAGKITMKCKVEYQSSENKAYIRLNTANCAYAKVKLNGKEIGIKYMRPYLYEAGNFLNNGSNDLEIEIAGTLFNLMGPNWVDDINNINYISPFLFDDLDMYTEHYTLMPLGVKSIEIVERR